MAKSVPKPSKPAPIKRPGPPIMPSKGERGSKVPSPGKMY